jgi:hypothetical protein
MSRQLKRLLLVVATARAIVYHFRDPGVGFKAGALEHAATTSHPDVVMSTANRRAEMGMRPGGSFTVPARVCPRRLTNRH